MRVQRKSAACGLSLVVLVLVACTCGHPEKSPVRIRIPETQKAPPPAGGGFLMPDPPPPCDDHDGDGWCDDDECNDDDPRVHPDALDVAGDRLDANCDGYDGMGR